MAFLTKEECVRRHRLLWNYVADQILEQKKVPRNYKRKAFEHFGWSVPIGRIFSYCWGCYYNSMKCFEMVDDPKHIKESEVNTCPYCLFNWTSDEHNFCSKYNTMFDWFTVSKLANDWEKAARIAREIANMPVRENV